MSVEDFHTWAIVLNAVATGSMVIAFLAHLRSASQVEQAGAFRSLVREVHRLGGRMTQFEVDYHGLLTRIESMSFSAMERQKEVAMAISEMTSSSASQLNMITKQLTQQEEFCRDVKELHRLLESRPCLAKESCPIGQDEEKT